MLKAALNALTRLHSRPAILKRLGETDMYSPIRVTPANYFRFLRGPEYVTVKGVEYIIPVDTMTGQFAQLLVFDRIPDGGTFKIQFGTSLTGDLNYSDTAADIQTALRLIPALAKVIVTGSFMIGFTIIFAGFSIAPDMGILVDSTLEESSEPVEETWSSLSVPWTELIKKGDRILEGNKLVAVDEIIEMHDLGAQVMAWRVRCD